MQHYNVPSHGVMRNPYVIFVVLDKKKNIKKPKVHARGMIASPLLSAPKESMPPMASILMPTTVWMICPKLIMIILTIVDPILEAFFCVTKADPEYKAGT